MAGPDDPERLPDDMAAAIGHAVSAFGFLEEALKRAIFSLTRKQLGEESKDATSEAFDNPPFDRSPLDGYAFAASGTKGAQKEAPASFRIIGEECAGDFFAQEVPEGAAVRLMTGAAIPKGCDCVVRQEDVTVQDECILVPYELHHHENYCFAGEDVRKGTRAVERGTELTAAHLGVLASLGFGTVKVLRRPRVAIASTGDELVLPGEPLRPGKMARA